MKRQAGLAIVASMLMTLSACAWGGPFGDSGRTSHNPIGGLDPTTVGTMTQQLQVDDPAVEITTLDSDFAIAAVEPTRTKTGRLQAYSAAGTDACSGTPRVCHPVWIANLGTDPFGPSGGFTSPAVLAGRFVAVSFVSGEMWMLAIYDRRGMQGCTVATPRVCSELGRVSLFPALTTDEAPALTVGDGSIYASRYAMQQVSHAGVHLAGLEGCMDTPTCRPFFRADTIGQEYSPAYFNGHLYVRTLLGASAFDATATQGCGSGTCAPLWTYESPNAGSSIAAAHGRVVINASGVTRVFDASGIDGCSGSPRRCQALWTSDSQPSSSVFGDAPIVTGSTVVALRGTATGTEVAAYDLNAGSGCSGIPMVCSARWRLPLAMTVGGLVGADNVGLVGGVPGAGVGPTLAFRLDGAGCHPVTHTCSSVASVSFPTPAAPTAVANGRVLYSYAGFPTRVYSIP